MRQIYAVAIAASLLAGPAIAQPADPKFIEWFERIAKSLETIAANSAETNKRLAEIEKILTGITPASKPPLQISHLDRAGQKCGAYKKDLRWQPPTPKPDCLAQVATFCKSLGYKKGLVTSFVDNEIITQQEKNQVGADFYRTLTGIVCHS